jgi:hypothetical protein
LQRPACDFGFLGQDWSWRGLALELAAADDFEAVVQPLWARAQGGDEAAYTGSRSLASPAFVAVWYSLGIALAGGLGAALGPGLLRW